MIYALMFAFACGGAGEAPKTEAAAPAEGGHEQHEMKPGDGYEAMHSTDGDGAAYACPMHPEETSDKPADCSKCGMHLEKQEKAE